MALAALGRAERGALVGPGRHLSLEAESGFEASVSSVLALLGGWAPWGWANAPSRLQSWLGEQGRGLEEVDQGAIQLPGRHLLVAWGLGTPWVLCRVRTVFRWLAPHFERRAPPHSRGDTGVLAGSAEVSWLGSPGAAPGPRPSVTSAALLQTLPSWGVGRRRNASVTARMRASSPC